MASAACDLEPAADPHAVRESSSVGGGQEEEAPTEAASAAAKEVQIVVEAEEGEEGAEEEEGECGFCLFMKGGGCKEAFVAWEDCVQAAEKEGSDLVERCFQATSNLKKCMDAHADYYYPVLQAEQAVSDQAKAAITTAADADKNKGEESAVSQVTDEKKEDSVVQKAESTAAAADEKKVVAEKDISSQKKEEAAVEKVDSLSSSN